MRLIDADELLEHAYRDRLDSRELIANMINNAPTIKEIPIKVPLDLVIKALELQPKTGHWKRATDKAGHIVWECKCGWQQRFYTNYCPDCGVRMEG